MFINEAKVSTEKEGKVQELKRENMDRLASLCGPHGPHASVSITLGTTIGYGEIKIDVSVTLTCDQNEGAMDEAARIAIEKGEEYMNLGLQAHDFAPVPFDSSKLWNMEKRPPTSPDRFRELCSGRGPLAHIGVSSGTTIGYGDAKMKSNVRLACDQSSDGLDKAAELAIEKSNEYTRWCVLQNQV